MAGPPRRGGDGKGRTDRASERAALRLLKARLSRISEGADRVLAIRPERAGQLRPAMEKLMAINARADRRLRRLREEEGPAPAVAGGPPAGLAAHLDAGGLVLIAPGPSAPGRGGPSRTGGASRPSGEGEAAPGGPWGTAGDHDVRRGSGRHPVVGG
jgi:hypothetical protein